MPSSAAPVGRVIVSTRYPRYGQPIAPAVLRGVLNVPVARSVAPDLAKRGVRLSGLDHTSWERFGEIACRRLGAQVVREAMRAFHNPVSRAVLIPRPPKGVSLADLELEVRTYNALARAGFSRSLAGVEKVTIGDLASVKGFGAKCLIDLLTALEAHSAEPPLHLRLRRSGAGRGTGSGRAATRAVLMEGPESLAEFVSEARLLLNISGIEGIRRDDPRFGGLTRGLNAPGANLREMVERTLAVPGSVRAVRRRLDAVRVLRRKIGDAATQSLREELVDLLTAVERGNARNAEIVASYLGWDGSGGTTLEQVGQAFGLTRERVRQLVKRAGERLQSCKAPYAPKLDAALGRIEKMLPVATSDVEADLVEQSITKSRFAVTGIREAADVLARSYQPSLVEVSGRMLVLPHGATDIVTIINRLGRRSTEHYGMTNLVDLTAQVSIAMGTEVDESTVRMVVDFDAAFAWLGESGGWLWAPEVPRNRLVNQIRKVLAVADRIRIGELRTAVGRHHRMNGFTPPRRALRSLCDQLPGCERKDDVVWADPQLDWRELLAENERTIAEVLKKSGPIMSRDELERACLAAGLNRSSFWIYLGYSPTVARFARGVYGIPGADAAPGQIESLIPQRVRHSKVLRDFGWFPDGRIWLGYRLSEGCRSSGVLSIPSAMRDFVQGEFEIHAPPEATIGKLVVAGSSNWGIGPFFRRRSPEPGDCLLLVLDPRTRKAEVRLGDEGIIEDPTAALIPMGTLED